jgi:hypothetical protein
MTAPGPSRRLLAGGVCLALLLTVSALIAPLMSSYAMNGQPTRPAQETLMSGPGPGSAASTELTTIYNARGDLQAAFPNALTNSSSFSALVSWAGGVVSGQWADPSYAALAPYGYWYDLMATYNNRPDLQSAFPDAYSNASDYHQLVSWAGGVVAGEWSDASYSTLAPFGYWYALMATYNSRSDLSGAFPHAYSNGTIFQQLVSWAGAVVSKQWADPAYSTLAPFGYWYDLMSIYNGRSDLQTAFPAAYSSFSSYTGLVDWAGKVVTGVFSDPSFVTLSSYGYYYDALSVYSGRSDLQSNFPYVYTNWGQQQGLMAWAGEVVTGVLLLDPSQPALQPYGYWYALVGWVYQQRSDLQSAYPLAFTDQASYQNLLDWADGVVTLVYLDPAYLTLLPFAPAYEALG